MKNSCFYCKGDVHAAKVIVDFRWGGGDLVVIEEVPAYVCTQGLMGRPRLARRMSCYGFHRQPFHATGGPTRSPERRGLPFVPP